MAITRYLGVYTLVRGALYFLTGAGALVFGAGGVAMGSFASLGVAVFGVLYLSIAFALFLSGGLLVMERKIGRLLAIVLLSVDTVFELFEGLVGGQVFSLFFAACSGAVVVSLLVWNPLSSGDGRTIDEESNAHEVGVEKF